MLITSKDNAQVKALKRLLQQAKRSDALMAVEGVHAAQLLLKHSLAHDAWIEKVWVGQSALEDPEIDELLQTVVARNIKVLELDDAIFREVSSLEQGVSIIFEVQRPHVNDLAGWNSTVNVMMLDGIQDPGNMGSILRSCAAAGVREVWLNAACVNPYAPKVLRAGVGAHFGLTIRENMDLLDALAQLKKAQVTICATSSYAEQSIYQTELKAPIAWLMGNEGAGVQADLLQQADVLLTIPMVLGESLNVAAATAICLFEMLRQQSHSIDLR